MGATFSLLGWLLLLVPFFCVRLAHAALLPSFGDEIRGVSGFHAIASNGNVELEVRLGDCEAFRLGGVCKRQVRVGYGNAEWRSDLQFEVR